MELREGYKQTEVGALPDDWDVKSLGEISYFTNGKAHEQCIDNMGDFVVVNSKFISTQGAVYKNSNQCISPLNKGDITMVMSDIPKGKALARCFTIPKDNRYTLNQRICSMHSNTIDNAFLALILNRNKYYLSFDSGTGQTNLKKSDVLKCPLPLPPTKTEQTAIANALSDADGLTQSLTHLITKKRQIKQGAMQTLLNPYEDGQLKAGWELKKLGDIGTFTKGSGVKKSEALSGTLPCIRYGEIYTKHCDYIKQFHSYISINVAQTAQRLKTGDLLFAGSGETKKEIGKCIAFVNNFEAYAGGDIVILSPTSSNSLFFGYYLNTNLIVSQKASMGQGDAIVHISATALGNINITIPSKIKEQTRIATILSDMDKEITALETKLSKAQQVKQGMMQHLLTGQIRLVKPATATGEKNQ